MGFEIEISPNEACAVEYESILVKLSFRKEQQDILISAPVTNPLQTDPLPKATLKKALKLAFNGYGTSNNFLGLTDNHLEISNYIPLTNLTAEDLLVRLYIFSLKAKDIADQLSALPEPENTDVQQDVHPLSLNFMMSV
ncbi:MAG: type III secretion system chaperone [Succinivibrio sp.]|nr:type III secretion system chaperone [Succinivibrio sp.]